MSPELPQGKHPHGGPERRPGLEVNYSNVNTPIQEFFSRQGALAPHEARPGNHQPTAERWPTSRERIEDEGAFDNE